MLRYFRRIEVRARELGNYRRKYLHGIERHGRLLIDRLEESESFDRVHVRQAAVDLGGEMDALLEAGHDDQERLRLLGCYQAIQFLLMNVRSLDRLRLNAPGAREPVRVYREFLQGVSEDFETLIREYISRVLGIFLAGRAHPDYVVCLVGTRLHQDDIDLGIFDDGGPGREELNHAVGRLAREMMRWTSVPDFYLSEHVGGEGYTVSIEEYRRRVERGILDFVSVSEILSSHPIAGSGRLFERLREEIHDRFYYRRRKPMRDHEGFVRGIAGEIRSLLLWPHDALHVRPKDDLLRLVTSVLALYRVVSQIRESDAWETLDHFEKNFIRRRGLPGSFTRSYVFVETFRHLYQQFAAQDEEIDLRDPEQQEGLQHVARAMGYEDIGVIRGWEQLTVNYFEHVQAGRDIVRALLPDIRRHIRRISVFSDWFRGARAGGGEGGRGRRNLAVDLASRLRYFQGIRYWDDFLEALESGDGGMLGVLLEDLMRLRPDRRRRILGYYARWAHDTFLTSLRLLTIIGRLGEKHGAREVFRGFNRALLDTIEGSPDEIRRFATVFVHYPSLVYEYLSMAGEETRDSLSRRFSGDVWDPQVARWRDQFRCLCDVSRKASPYFRRAIDRVRKRNPEYLLYLGAPEKLGRITQGMLAELMRLPSPESRKDKLVTYYDLEYLRIGLATLQGHPLAELDAEYTEFADHFLQTLFDVCKAEVDGEVGRRTLTHDHLALFVAGGQARERAHQDDWDLIVLLNSDSEEMYEYSNRIITHLNRAIVRCGIVPQYRFADLFGGYVTRFSEIERFLLGEGKEAYIEMSQLVGARLVVGSGRLEAEFARRIIEGCIHAQKEIYVRALTREILSRHEHAGGREGGGETEDRIGYDIKECRGGLRDLEMSQLLWKISSGIREPMGGRFWDALATELPGGRERFEALKESYEFLNRLRDVYRLSVAPQDRLDPRRFALPAEILGYEDSGGLSGAERLEADFRRHRERVARNLEELMQAGGGRAAGDS